ncbi:MAG: thiamine pyrophosphate-dependent enzyme [Xanthobacteraceae bacterium]
MTAAESERAAECRKKHEADKTARRLAELDSGYARATAYRCSRRFMADLAERLAGLERPALIFDEALTSAPDLLRYLPQDEPGAWFQTRVGMLGTGLPGTVGLKLAHPDRTVFGFAGDGGAMSTIQTLATARYGIGAKFVVCNNRSYRILKYNLRQYRRDRAAGGRAAHTAEPGFSPIASILRRPTCGSTRLRKGRGWTRCASNAPTTSRLRA